MASRSHRDGHELEFAGSEVEQPADAVSRWELADCGTLNLANAIRPRFEVKGDSGS